MNNVSSTSSVSTSLADPSLAAAAKAPKKQAFAAGSSSGLKSTSSSSSSGKRRSSSLSNENEENGSFGIAKSAKTKRPKLALKSIEGDDTWECLKCNCINPSTNSRCGGSVNGRNTACRSWKDGKAVIKTAVIFGYHYHQNVVMIVIVIYIPPMVVAGRMQSVNVKVEVASYYRYELPTTVIQTTCNISVKLFKVVYLRQFVLEKEGSL